MFNFLSKITKRSQPSPAEPSAEPSDSAKNRVTYSPGPSQKPKAVTKKPKITKANPKIQQLLKNAQRLEAEAKEKENEIFQRLKSLDNKEKYLIQKDQQLDQERAKIDQKLAAVDELYKKQLEKLETISNFSVDQAKKLVIENTERRLTSWIAQKITEAKEAIRQKEEELTAEILADSLRHGITDYVAEYTVSTISLPDDKIKGKIIGREGRNIRAFEKATGVELELDETNDVRISSFDSTRREIAKIALQKLIKDGRIQPVKIEKVVEQTQAEMDKILINEGKRICQIVGVFNLPIDLIKQIGKYKFRFSYGQNLAKHTIEATKIAIALAHQLNADVKVVRLGGLLHDIGKVVSDQEGTHIDLGINLLQKYKFPQKVIDCIAQHHEDENFTSIESVLVHLGDAASGTRPGARYEVHEEYLARMQNIEDVAKKFPGVTDVAAYQAGREVMVIVDPGKVSDDQALVLSQNIAESLEEEAKWAGQIKVTVVRELRTSSTITGSKVNKNAGKNNQ